MPKGTIGHDRDIMALAPGDDRMLDGAFAEMVENLVAGDLAFARDTKGLAEIILVEIADSPGEYLTFSLEVFEGAEGFGERILAAPMQEIAIEPVRLEALERCFASAPRPALGRIGRQHLG